MSSEALRDLFVQSDSLLDQHDEVEDSTICLHFRYGKKNYCTSINEVKEIIDFPRVIPFPVNLPQALGVFNLRGNIVPVFDPESHLVKIQELHRFKSPSVFAKMKLRLIVFETSSGMTVAFPAYEVGKFEVSSNEANSEQSFIRVNGIPYEKFDIKTIVEGNL